MTLDERYRGSVATAAMDEDGGVSGPAERLENRGEGTCEFIGRRVAAHHLSWDAATGHGGEQVAQFWRASEKTSTNTRERASAYGASSCRPVTWRWREIAS